ncbi:TspO/MBR family protein [Anoxynatronum buryatiense]|uniref:TspO and MBR related proteins n=1 Tax=Anoxynatronum buryatiense TaxID=489973 RepID=A0AA45WV30_9CLOT|nr:TspO/MBR family protein [Anoxynatronum buryatiense]SMP51721.1 TspO and MBR related proteins [Anoxynatronum buryatiense]
MTRPYSTVYTELAKPPLSPPGWVFGPVWTILYILMGIAAFRVFSAGIQRGEVKRALAVFFVQLGLNLLWPYLYFTLNVRGVAFVELLLLLFVIGLTIFLFHTIDKLAAYLMLPYMAWVLFAGYLNGATWWLNRGIN